MTVYKRLIVALILAVATLLLYLPVQDHSFLKLDDSIYVTSVPQVRQGLTWEGVGWALTTLEAAFWHPLTWLSHMLDAELYGLNAGGHHMTNVLLHAMSVVLLMWVLDEMTGALWCSAFVAAMFALHPLNVESVAWVAERKNVLSTLLWMVTMGVYVGYVRKPGWGRYAGLMGVFVLGLMAKPMLVTLPCVLLLLDYWPLGRMGEGTEMRRRLPKLAMEKAPLLVPVGVASVLAVKAQSGFGALPPLELLPLGARAANAVLSYGLYLKKMVWPADLAVLYPHPGTSVSVWSVLLSGVLLLLVTVLVWKRRERSRYLPVGWLWYVGTLVPVSGLIQVGGHAMADRFAYVPLIGVFVMLVWGAAEIRQRTRREWLVGVGVCVVVALIILARAQVSHWRSDRALFEHVLKATENNSVAHYNLGTALAKEERWEEAIHHFRQALEIYPYYVAAYINLGSALARQGKVDEAILQYKEAIRLNPESYRSYDNLGVALSSLGKLDDAIDHFNKALSIKPDYASAYNNLGRTLEKKNLVQEARRHFSTALKIDPDYMEARENLQRLQNK